MTKDEIIEIMVVAAEVDRRLPQTAKPARLRAMSLPFVHSHQDQAGWGAERYQQERADFFDARSTRLTKNEIGLWLASMHIIKLCPSGKKRRALLAWSRSQAGSGTFARWCHRVEGISRQLGDWRKNAAISEIELAFDSKPLLHTHKGENNDFTEEPEIGHKKGTVEAWRDVDAKPLRAHFDTDIAGLEWAAIQNAKRRDREARRRKAA